MDRKKYIYIYLAVFALLIVHFGVAKFYAEPFPAFVFPSFSKVERIDDIYRIHIIDMYAIDSKNDTILVEKRHSLAPATMVHANAALKTVLQKEQMINDQFQQTDLSTQPKDLSKTIAERESFLSMMKDNLHKKYPARVFNSLLILEGVQGYSLKDKKLLDTLLEKETTLIQLQ